MLSVVLLCCRLFCCYVVVLLCCLLCVVLLCCSAVTQNGCGIGLRARICELHLKFSTQGFEIKISNFPILRFEFKISFFNT